MSEELKETSRREFLKRTLRKTGYVVPLIVALNMNSREAWAENYGNGREPGGHDGKCDSLVEKVFNPSCW